MTREGESVANQGEQDQEFVGYAPAAEYLGIVRNTLSSYVARGIGPEIARQHIEGQYVLPVFTRSGLDRWVNSRPGQGARTDLMQPSA